ncbi:MAG: TIGR02147 family protein [Fibrobacter sp.]|nr:TIGR02147 family protein [Fibrobacter sp.]
MNSIFEYTDYHLYLKDFYEERRQMSGLSWRGFSRLVGFKSGLYLKLVCDGKTKLSVVGADRFAKAVEFNKIQTDYLCAMVVYCNTPVEKKRVAAYRQMQSIIEENKIRVVGNDDYNYYSSWWNPILRELAPRLSSALPIIVAGMFYDEVSAADVQRSLDFLVRAGFLKKGKHHTYSQLDRGIQGSSEMIPQAIRNMHKKMAEFAVKAIENFPKTDRNFSGLTVAVGKSTYAQIVKELDDCRKRVADIVSAAEDGDRIFRLNMQLFPVTKEIKK